MTKKDYAFCVTHSEAWDGCSEKQLVKNYTLQELKDIYAETEEAEEEYMNDKYGNN